ncbi:MAG: CHRD domain-containing protein [Chthoniobacterales bacterium]
MKTPSLTVRLTAVFIALGLASANAQNLFYTATLTGPNESPPNASPATGIATIVVNPTTNILSLTVIFAGLVGTTTASHIHAATPTPFSGTAGVATTTPFFANFPIGVQSGTFFIQLDLTQSSSFNPSYVAANGGTTASAAAALIAAIQAGESYLNIHTTFAPGGEIRGFLVAAPETGTTWSLMLLGLAALGVTARRLRRV